MSWGAVMHKGIIHIVTCSAGSNSTPIDDHHQCTFRALPVHAATVHDQLCMLLHHRHRAAAWLPVWSALAILSLLSTLAARASCDCWSISWFWRHRLSWRQLAILLCACTTN